MEDFDIETIDILEVIREDDVTKYKALLSGETRHLNRCETEEIISRSLLLYYNYDEVSIYFMNYWIMSEHEVIKLITNTNDDIYENQLSIYSRALCLGCTIEADETGVVVGGSVNKRNNFDGMCIITERNSSLTDVYIDCQTFFVAARDIMLNSCRVNCSKLLIDRWWAFECMVKHSVEFELNAKELHIRQCCDNVESLTTMIESLIDWILRDLVFGIWVGTAKLDLTKESKLISYFRIDGYDSDSHLKLLDSAYTRIKESFGKFESAAEQLSNTLREYKLTKSEAQWFKGNLMWNLKTRLAMSFGLSTGWQNDAVKSDIRKLISKDGETYKDDVQLTVERIAEKHQDISSNAPKGSKSALVTLLNKSTVTVGLLEKHYMKMEP